MTFSFQPIEVLLVEDDAGDELMTREAFAEHKISNRLHVVRDGQEALDFLFRGGAPTGAPRVDLILLDLNLPKYDGRQVLERIRSDPDLTHVPVVILTTSASEEDILRSYKSRDQRARRPASASASVSAGSGLVSATGPAPEAGAPAAVAGALAAVAGALASAAGALA